MLDELFWSSKEVGHAPCSMERQPLSLLMIPKPSVLGSAQGKVPEKKDEITSQQNPLA